MSQAVAYVHEEVGEFHLRGLHLMDQHSGKEQLHENKDEGEQGGNKVDNKEEEVCVDNLMYETMINLWTMES